MKYSCGISGGIFMSRFLEELRKFIETQPFNVIRISEIHNGGEIETDNYCNTNANQNVYSVAKVFTMTAIGLLYDKGLLRLDENVCDILADELPESGMDDRWHLCTVEMALRHRIGVPVGLLDIDTTDSSEFGEDYLGYMLTYPLAYTPDTDSKYSDAAYYLLSRIAEKKSGMSLENFLWKEVFLKLGFQEIAWSHCPQGHAMGATGLYISSADMAKLGLVYLDGGMYRGERILSEEWVKLAVDRNFSLDWDPTHTVYFKGGMHGQKLYISPAQNRVTALQGFGVNTDVIANWIAEYRD